jgi:hypothetical protein
LLGAATISPRRIKRGPIDTPSAINWDSRIVQVERPGQSHNIEGLTGAQRPCQKTLERKGRQN